MRARVGADDRCAPGPAHQIEPGKASRREDMVDRGAKIVHRVGGGDDRLVLLRRLVHGGRPRRAAVAAYVDEIDVEAGLREQIHHRDALDRQIESRFRRIGRAMHEKQGAVGPEAFGARKPLVADEEPDAGFLRWDRIALGLDLGLSPHRGEHGGKNRERRPKSGAPRAKLHLMSPKTSFKPSFLESCASALDKPSAAASCVLTLFCARAPAAAITGSCSQSVGPSQSPRHTVSSEKPKSGVRAGCSTLAERASQLSEAW